MSEQACRQAMAPYRQDPRTSFRRIEWQAGQRPSLITLLYLLHRKPDMGSERQALDCLACAAARMLELVSPLLAGENLQAARRFADSLATAASEGTGRTWLGLPTIRAGTLSLDFHRECGYRGNRLAHQLNLLVRVSEPENMFEIGAQALYLAPLPGDPINRNVQDRHNWIEAALRVQAGGPLSDAWLDRHAPLEGLHADLLARADQHQIQSRASTWVFLGESQRLPALRREIARREGIEHELQLARRSLDGLREKIRNTEASRESSLVRERQTAMALMRVKEQQQPPHAPPATAMAGPAAPPAADQHRQELARLRASLAFREDERSALRREVFDLQRQVQALIAASAPERTDVLPVVETPESLAGIQAWAEVVLEGRVKLHPQAIARAVQSNYHNPGKVYDALRALADLYWPMLFAPSPERRPAWEQRLVELYLDCNPVGEAPRQPRTADAYRFLFEGRPYVMDLHLQGSSSFDPRFGLRIYFTVDRQGRRILVGSLPTHLPNRIGN